MGWSCQPAWFNSQWWNQLLCNNGFPCWNQFLINSGTSDKIRATANKVRRLKTLLRNSDLGLHYCKKCVRQNKDLRYVCAKMTQDATVKPPPLPQTTVQQQRPACCGWITPLKFHYILYIKANHRETERIQPTTIPGIYRLWKSLRQCKYKQALGDTRGL
jgi:hypothetical protein